MIGLNINFKFISIPDEAIAKISEYMSKIKDGTYTHRAKSKSRSPVWQILHEIFDDRGKKVANFYYCTTCKKVLYNYSHHISGNTTQLRRHACISPLKSTPVNMEDFENLKQAAAKFVCLDFRPFNAVECTGLRDMLAAAFEIGQKYPNMSTDEFLTCIPSRNTVKTTVSGNAANAKPLIEDIFEEAIKQGGFGCTLDLWTDNFKSISYMVITANAYLLRDAFIEQKRLVFHMNHITDIVKSKEVIKAHIIKVFHDFGLDQHALKTNVTFTTDR